MPNDDKHPSIVIIDDEKFITDVLTDLLEQKPYNVTSFNCSEQGFKSLVKDQPDILFLDLFMPNVDGLKIIKDVKSECHNTKIVLMSGGFDILEKDTYVDIKNKFGADAILDKPFRIKDIEATLNSLVIAD